MDYTKLEGPELLAECRDDATKWAAAFCQHAKALGHDIDEGWMMVWFANAIEHSHDVRTGTAPVVLPDGTAFFVAVVGDPPPKAPPVDFLTMMLS